MTNQKLSGYIDHTLLKASAEWAEIKKLCAEAIRYGAASVCVPPCYVRRIRDEYGDQLRICTVIGFPHGNSVPTAKMVEARQAVADGADEIDMVINISDAKNGDFGKVLSEIKLVREAASEAVLKVIVEACYLTEQEKIRICGIVSDAGADYIKTSTGFGPAGASLEDVRLFRRHIGPNVKIKAAGGIRTREALEDFIEAGCSRIGASCTGEILGG
ncbi:MAG: deoxyribose-phosphate aldolase [Clostridiales Family XIII bacterium]|jgi:deoxyribose-phosphate aldolase|nr:deoxyribose-phosphate aldolase [Clostridiales Family XIII bacterium]